MARAHRSSSYRFLLSIAILVVLAVSAFHAQAFASPAQGGSAQTAAVYSTGSPAEKKHETPLQEGTYFIVCADSTTAALDAAGGRTAKGTNVQLYQANNSGAQRWHVSYDAEGLYTFVNVKSGRALDLAGAKAKNGSNIHLFDKNGTKAQKWIVVASGNGYMLQSAVNRSFVIDCKAGRSANGTNVQLYRSNATAAQRFAFFPCDPQVESAGRTVEDGIYVIESLVGSGKALDVAAASPNNRANVQIYAANDTTAQRWVVRYGNDGFYTLTSLVSGRMLDVDAGLKVPGANVQQYGADGLDAQKWSFVPNSDGTFCLVNKGSGLHLAVQGGKNANGANVQLQQPSTSNAQKFSFKRVSVLADGVYCFYSKLAQTRLALDIRANSVADGAWAQLYTFNGSTAQRFAVVNLGDDVCTIQSVASGKYLADANGAVVQQARPAAGVSDAQKWRLAWQGTGIVATNVATGKAMVVAGGKASDAARVVTGVAQGGASRFRVMKQANLVAQGLYTLKSRASSSVLDVHSGSWDSGANARLFKSNGTNAQKFALVPLGNDDYRIVMVLAGTVLEASASSGVASANARMGNVTGKAGQVWHAQLTDGGIVFVNKATGMVLGASAAKAPSGSNAVVQQANGAPSQSWHLLSTQVGITDADTLLRLVTSALSGGKPALSARGFSYSISAGANAQLMGALAAAWNRGETVGFVMVDTSTGISLALNADTSVYGASTFKGAYVTYLFQELIEKGRLRYDDVGWLMEQTVVHSNNLSYELLRQRYGYAGFKQWLSQVGAGHLAHEYYPFTTARTLEAIWTKIYAYEQSGGAYVGRWRSIFSHSDYSAFYEALGGGATVFSKPGWYPNDGVHTALNDGAIVCQKDGSTYIVAMLTKVNCITERWIARDIARALDRIHREMPR